MLRKPWASPPLSRAARMKPVFSSRPSAPISSPARWQASKDRRPRSPALSTISRSTSRAPGMAWGPSRMSAKEVTPLSIISTQAQAVVAATSSWSSRSST